MDTPLESLAYPIGRWAVPADSSVDSAARSIARIAVLPGKLRDAVAGLNDSQLDTPYRSGGWTVRQVVHHVADSHINAYIRFRLALTEDNPRVTAYDQKAWAGLADAKTGPVDVSLGLLTYLHRRWVELAQSLIADNFKRQFVHPGLGRTLDLAQMLDLYAWHGEHHTVHVVRLCEREGW